jgi:hemerythrin-like domain-containing protein
MVEAIRVIEREHRKIDTVLALLRRRAAEAADGGAIDAGLFVAIIDYMKTFPGGIHHPKEESHLFTALERRDPSIAPLLDLLREEHEVGRALVAGLEEVLAFCRRDRSARGRFRDSVNAYVDFERRHMAREERDLLPIATRILTAGGWRDIDAAFAATTIRCSAPRRASPSSGCWRRSSAFA